MPRRKSLCQFHVGDIVIYDNQRMRIAGFPTDNLMTLTAQVLFPGRPTHQTVSVTDKKISIVTQVNIAHKED